MAKILNFEDFLSKKELDKITDFCSKEFAEPVKFPKKDKPKEEKPLVTLKRPTEPPRAA
jgi:hypothetical protein